MLAMAWAAALSMFLLPAAIAADSCTYARDGQCDEPTLCRHGSDETDCAGTRNGATALAQRHRAGSATDVSTADAILALLAWLGAALIMKKRLAGFRSGWLALAAALLGAALVVDAIMPATVADAADAAAEAAGVSGFGVKELLATLGAALMLYLLYRSAPDTSDETQPMGGLAAAALGPDIHEGDANEVSHARAWCARTAAYLEQALKEKGGRYQIYSVHDCATTPWIKVERLVHGPGGEYITSMRIDFRPQPFGQFPVLVDLVIDSRGRRRRITSAYELGEQQLHAALDCLLGHTKRLVWRGLRARELFWQLHREKQTYPDLEPPLITGFRQNLYGLALLGVGIAALPVAAASPYAAVLLVASGVYAYRRWYVPPPRYRIARNCPPRPPRMLRGLDSWQVVVRDLGEARERIVERFEKILNDRLASADRGADAVALSGSVSIRQEDIWYIGPEGKVERQQLTVSLRRSIVFVRIYQYGQDLFVGWDAHVNLLSWKDKEVAAGRRADSRNKVSLVSTETSYHPVNEYDLTDANFLLEAVHAHLTAMLKDVLRERQIDQELDFTIVRESRQTLMSESNRPERRRFSTKPA